jgi:transcriptional regulator with XRE-family HTH domain
MDFWDNVRKEMKLQRLTQETVALKAGMDINTFRSAMSKKNQPLVGRAIAIAKALDVTVEFLTTGLSVDDWSARNEPFLADCRALAPNRFIVHAYWIHEDAESARNEFEHYQEEVQSREAKKWEKWMEDFALSSSSGSNPPPPSYIGRKRRSKKDSTTE